MELEQLEHQLAIVLTPDAPGASDTDFVRNASGNHLEVTRPRHGDAFVIKELDVKLAPILLDVERNKDLFPLLKWALSATAGCERKDHRLDWGGGFDGGIAIPLAVVLKVTGGGNNLVGAVLLVRVLQVLPVGVT